MADEFNQTQDNGQVQAAVSEALAKQKRKKRQKRLYILGIIVGGIALAIGILSGSEEDVKQVEPDTDAVSKAETTQFEDQQTFFCVGEAVQINNLKITYTSCDTNFTDYNEFLQPDSGMKYVRATFTFENTGTVDTYLSNFSCYADDVVCEASYVVSDYNSPSLQSISSGKKFNAVVYYQVPYDSEEIILQYETNYWSSDYVEFAIR